MALAAAPVGRRAAWWADFVRGGCDLRATFKSTTLQLALGGEGEEGREEGFSTRSDRGHLASQAIPSISRADQRRGDLPLDACSENPRQHVCLLQSPMVSESPLRYLTVVGRVTLDLSSSWSPVCVKCRLSKPLSVTQNRHQGDTDLT